MYAYSKSTPPAFIGQPLSFISVLSSSKDIGPLEDTCYYRSANFSDVLELFAQLSKSSSYYSVEATANGNKLTFSSQSEHLILSLREHTFFHHSYAGRYTRFTKDIPPKGSPGLEVRYNAEITMDPSLQHYRDIVALITSEFSGARVTVIAESSSDLGGLLKQLEHRKPSSTITPIAPHSDLSSLVKDVPPGCERELYEYLCLLHLNALPNMDDSHTRATNTYECPEAADVFDVDALYLHTFSDASPQLFYQLLNNQSALSVLGRTDRAHWMSYNGANNVYFWSVT